MTLGVIELNDIGITVHSGERVLIESPGYALLQSNSLLVGHEAYAKARLNPRRTHTRFWDQLSLDPLAQSTATVRHHADIAYAHLAHIWEQIKSQTDEILFAVPPAFAPQQLGLLLGIAEQCAMPVVGLVDSAVAASSESVPADRELFHLDIQLHRILLTELSQDARLDRAKVSQFTKAGWISLMENWANTIADAFVRETRFDPMHAAITEQQLYDKLPAWLASLERNEATKFEMQVSDKTQQVTLGRDRLSSAAAEIYGHILQLIRSSAPRNEPIVLQVSHRFSDFPGFFAHLAELNHCEIIRLGSGAAARGATKNRLHICRPGNSRVLVTHIPWQRPSLTLSPPKTPTRTPAAKPTHLLYRTQAYPIGEQALIVGAAIPENSHGFNLSGPLNGVSRSHFSVYTESNQIWVDDHSTYGTFLNGQKIDGRTVVKLGDKLRVGTPGEELQFIALVNLKQSHGA